MCWDTCATKGWQPPVSQPGPSHTCSPELQNISIISLLGMVRAGQLQNVVPELGMPHGQPPPLLLSRVDATTARTISNNKGVWKLMSCGHRSVGLSVPSANSAWPFSSVLPSARLVFSSCCNFLLLFSPRWEYNTCTRGNIGKSFNGKATPGAGRGLKVSGFEKHHSKSRCFHSHRQELIVGSALAYRLSFLWLCPQSLWLLSVVSDRTHKEVFH